MKRPEQKSPGRFSMFDQLQVTLPRLHPKLTGRHLYSLASLSILLVTLARSTPTNGQVNVSSSAQPNLARLKWTKPTGAERYRLQIARFDGIVSGEEYLVRDPSSGGINDTKVEKGFAICG